MRWPRNERPTPFHPSAIPTDSRFTTQRRPGSPHRIAARTTNRTTGQALLGMGRGHFPRATNGTRPLSLRSWQMGQAPTSTSRKGTGTPAMPSGLRTQSAKGQALSTFTGSSARPPWDRHISGCFPNRSAIHLGHGTGTFRQWDRHVRRFPDVTAATAPRPAWSSRAHSEPRRPSPSSRSPVGQWTGTSGHWTSAHCDSHTSDHPNERWTGHTEDQHPPATTTARLLTRSRAASVGHRAAPSHGAGAC